MKKTKKRTQEMENASEIWLTPRNLRFVEYFTVF
jgi:hypothetical protein